MSGVTVAELGGFLGAASFLLGTAWGFFCGWLICGRVQRGKRKISKDWSE